MKCNSSAPNRRAYNFVVRNFSLRLALAGLMLCGISGWLQAAPFDDQIDFRQPDGTMIRLHGWGDEFHAVFETQDGFTVVFDQVRQAYCYARQDKSGQLVSLGVLVHQADPVGLGLKPHERMSFEARKQQVALLWQRWEDQMQIEAQWQARKVAMQPQLSAASASDTTNVIAHSPPSFSTTGVKVGLTLLVDFSDDPATIPQADIINFCNGDGYTGYGNNGSVKSYYYDNSGGLLTYTNVVTIYIRVPQPKTYYNVTTNDCGLQGRLLINDALTTLMALTNYNTEILPILGSLTVDGSSRVVACNVFFAGANSGVWDFGLWPHSWSLASSVALGNGKKVYKYQITNLGASLALGTFCHENGHMLCGYPDIYDYDYDSKGGAGVFCLMNSGGSGTNPKQICAYLKRASGWATTVELNSSSSLIAVAGVAGTNFNRFYRYQKPGVPTEYFLIENRQKTGRDSGLPAAGLAIWHVDELGNHNYQNTNYNTTHTNYEVSLMQADNLWHFQNNTNIGDANDLYYAGNSAVGYNNEFTDTSGPNAFWWDGSGSGLRVTDISASAATMTFRVGLGPPPLNVAYIILADHNRNGVVDYNETNRFWIILRNEGIQIASNILATLDCVTANVSVLQNTSAYPNAAPGQLVTNTTPFVFSTAPAFVCGTQIQFTDLASCTGRTTTNVIPLASGNSGSSVRSDNNTAAAIQDFVTTLSTNIVAGFDGLLNKVTVSLYLTHSWDADLIITLISPDGTTNLLSNKRGSSGDNFGSAATPDSSRTTFDDYAGVAITNGTAPFVGSFRPEQTFTVYTGKSGAAVNGPWVLSILDNGIADVGALQAWSLMLTSLATCVDGSQAPTPPTLKFSISGSSLNLTWPTNYSGLRLQSQTNFLGSGLGTNWTDVSGVITNGWTAPMNTSSGSVFFRLFWPWP